jgi:hypothetical protein
MPTYISRFEIGQRVYVDADVPGIITAVQFQKYDSIIRVAIWNNGCCNETWFEDWRIERDAEESLK